MTKLKKASSNLTTVASPTSVILTVGGILVGAKVVSDQIKDIIEKVGIEFKEALRAIDEDLNRTIQNLERTYKDNLNVTLDSLDAFTSNKLLELQATFDQINKAIQEDIELITQKAQETIRQARIEIQRATVELENSLKNVIVVGGETIAYVLDRAIYNAILIASLVLVGVGLLLFTGYLFKQGLPGGFGGFLALVFMGAFLAIFGVLSFVPKLRGYIMNFTGIGLRARLEKHEQEPRIWDLVPRKITLTRTQELKIWGIALFVNGKPPVVKVDTEILAPKAASPELIVVDIANFNFSKPEGSYNLVLQYDGTEGPRDIIEIARPIIIEPPDVIITPGSFAVDPPSPEQRRNCRIRFSVHNQGRGAAGSCWVEWQPLAGESPQRVRLNGLNVGESRELSFDYAYLTTGEVQSVVIVDSAHELTETNESNNSATLNFSVRPYQRQLVASTSQIKLFESDLDVDTGIDVAAGDRLVVRASGKIWPGFLGQSDCGPEGYTKALADKDTFPLTGVAKFCLLYRLNGRYHYVGALHDSEVMDGGRLYLRINDDEPNNGSKREKEKFYSSDIEVWR